MNAPITVRPIVFTARPGAWLRTLAALGARTVVDDEGGWTVLALAAGRVAVHAVTDDDALAGTTRLAFEVPDLVAFHADRGDALRAANAVVERVEAGHGTMLAVSAPDGALLQVDPLEPGTGTAPSPSGPALMPLWYSPDVDGARRVLEALGLRARIGSADGGWVDLAAPGRGGRHAVHHGERAGGELSFEHDDVVALAQQLEQAGVAVDVIDESHGRTARVASPERPTDVDARIWVNEVQRDLYGYVRWEAESV